jgi:hypothetical protein
MVGAHKSTYVLSRDAGSLALGTAPLVAIAHRVTPIS